MHKIQKVSPHKIDLSGIVARIYIQKAEEFVGTPANEMENNVLDRPNKFPLLNEHCPTAAEYQFEFPR
jgi:hypothetical protein